MCRQDDRTTELKEAFNRQNGAIRRRSVFSGPSNHDPWDKGFPQQSKGEGK